MTIPKSILKHLEKNKIKYQVIPHKKVYTAYDLAATLKEDIKKIAKTLLVRADKRYYLVTIPAHYQLDFGKIKKLVKAKTVELAKEKIMVKLFKVKPGALTPFASFHKVELVADNSLKKLADILVGAGSYTESLRIKTKDWLKSEKPIFGAIGKIKKFKPIKTKSKKRK
ncbi:MAG: YbaK/EbsC family protein [Patescibacteria group bacterium]|nr:YbaK/EbsC family protein [Patescibacteria group bacterium]MDD5490219.1 YbaK/EbsC family protein [Patescibacteria group bacterium]